MKASLQLVGEEEYSYAVLPLDLVESFLRRFVSYPSEHALVAHTLWIAHTHMIQRFDTTPRLAFMSAEKASGKTRALEITSLFVPDPILSINASPAAIVRLIAASPRTILYDEIDAVFGSSKAQESNADLCAILNGGYRRGAKVYRCSTSGKKVEVEELEAFSPVAVAGLRTLPDTLASRSIFVRMRKRAPDEEVEHFRERIHSLQAKPIKDALAEWCAERNVGPVEPELPSGIYDRNADLCEPLLVVADEAGGDWPTRGRAALVHLATNATDESMTPGVELLLHIREAFDCDEKIWTKSLLRKLSDRDESPWKDIRGKELDDRGLGRRLQPYGIKARDVRIGADRHKGFHTSDFYDAWKRYLPSAPLIRDKGDKGDIFDNKNNFVADVADVAATEPKGTDAHPLNADPFGQFKDPSLKLQRGG